MADRRMATTATRTTAKLRAAIRRARNSVGLSQEACGVDVGVSTDSIGRWENGDAKPDFAKLLDAPIMGPAFRDELERMLAAEFGKRRMA